MELLTRTIETDVEQYLADDALKILFIWGPRRSGKTTIIEGLAKRLNTYKYNFDLISDREKFEPRRDVLEKIALESPIVLIDEVQNYPEATVSLKILHDEFKVKIIATGSSELRQKASKEFDTLAGRFKELYCLPLAISEVVFNNQPRPSDETEFLSQSVKNCQIWGSYPEVYTMGNKADKEKTDLLQKIVDTYVLKDIIDIYELKNEKLAKDILTKIALQLGSEVSVRELANSLGANVSTISNYVEIFIKNYVLIPLPSFKTNMRKAVSENRKLYFYDLGIRNALIQDFRDLELRQDKGGVFENFLVAELEKKRRLTNAKVNFYFYREYGGKEIDFVLEDYKKNYLTLEFKSQKGRTQNIFPLPSVSDVLTSKDCYHKIEAIFKDR